MFVWWNVYKNQIESGDVPSTEFVGGLKQQAKHAVTPVRVEEHDGGGGQRLALLVVTNI